MRRWMLGVLAVVALGACSSEEGSVLSTETATTVAQSTTAAVASGAPPATTLPPATTTAAAPVTTATTRPPTTTSGLTPAQRNAVRSAESYLRSSGFSRQRLIDQLSSPHADKYSVADATAAVDSLTVDWNAEAMKAAQAYLRSSGFSCQRLIDQLSSQHADRFTPEQARFGATQAGAC